MNYNFLSLILTLLLLQLTACKEASSGSTTVRQLSQRNIVLSDSLELRKLEGLVYDKTNPFTGTALDYYPDGQEEKAIDYVEGRKEGQHLLWFKNGIKSYEAHYKNGKKEGETSSWWRNGKLRSKSYFIAGIAHGEQLQWYKSGAKFKSINLVDGKEEGMQKSWRENGKIYNNYEAKNGRIFGLKRAALCFQLDNETVVYGKD